MTNIRRAVVVVALAFVSVAAFGQSADQAISVTDSPDPVTPGNNITYAITVTNNGPNPATNGGFNASLASGLTFQSATPPAGFSCATFGQNVSCTNPSFAAGATANFTLVAQLAAHLLNSPDGSVTSIFSTSGTTADPVGGNNSVNVTTAYDSPQIDLSLTVTDSPDPVTPNNNITYTVPVTNAGPNAATNVNFNSFNNGSLRFQSATVPAGWSCTLPAVNGTPTFTCTNPSFPGGATSTFTVVVRADSAVLGVNDGTVSTNFNVNGTGNDTNNANNSETENTAYVTPDADMAVAVTDSPDPVTPNNNITYTVTVTNNGPDAATSATLNSFNNGTLRFQSATVPAGWNCTLPAVNATPTFTCTNPSFANGASSVFTFVVRADSAVLGINDGTVSTHFNAGSSLSDPNNANNGETESTAYVTPDADMAVAVTDSPDPVTPNNNITYTVTVTNNGPDAATSATLNSFNNGTLRFQSATVPAGWNCTLPAVNATPTFTCTNPSLANGASSVFTFVVRADSAVLGINDGTVSTAFTAGSSIADPNNANNNETENTAYVTPDADMAVAVTDSPDPVTPNNNITYTVTVTNSGPDAATSATLNSTNNGTLRFQSATVPAGWNCTLPAVNATPTFTCTNPSFANGGSSVFTFVVRADSAILGNLDQTVSTHFNAGSSLSDPNNANNGETENTAYDVVNANLGITMTDSPDPVVPGNNITYSGSLTNAGPDTATSVVVTAALHPSLLFQSVTAPAGFTCTTPAVGANGTVTCSGGTMANAANVPFTLVTRVNPSLLSGPDGTIQQTFTISSAASDTVNANNSVTVNTAYVTPDADLAVTKTDSPDPVTSGSTITYTATIANTGPDAASNVTLTDTLPASVTFQSLAAAAGWTCNTPAVGAGGTITCSKPSMANAESATFTLVVNVVAASGTVSNTITATSATHDPDTPDNTATAATQIQAAQAADLAITKSTTATTAPQGTNIPYTITVTNNGPNAATSVVMTDVLPASLRFISIAAPAGFTCATPAAGTNGTITCNGATLANGATAVFTLTVRVATEATPGGVVNSASVSSATSDPVGGNSSGGATSVTLAAASADLSVTKTSTAASVVAGATMPYTITVTNSGPDPASFVSLTDVLPAQLRFESINAPAGWTCTTPAAGANGTITCTIPSLPNGASAVFNLTVRAAAGATGSIVNSATLGSTTSDPDAGDRAGTAPGVPVVAAGADLSITKTTTATTAVTNSVIPYVITVSNAGPSVATNVTVTDTLPAGLQFVSATPSQGSCSGTSTVTCVLGTLAVNGTATITLSARVTATSGTISNTASVAGAEPDPNGGNSGSGTPPLPAMPPEDIPTLSEWALMALAAMLGAIAVMRVRG